MKKKKLPAPAKKRKVPTNRKSAVTPIKSIAMKSKLAKQQEAEALKAHDLYWKSYINGDTKTLASLLDDHYTQIGSVENEVFFYKKDAVRFVKSTIDQIAGNVQMRNRVTNTESIDEFILVSEQCDLYVLTEREWIFYSKFRASSFMAKRVDGWKMIHQHSSLPDAKAQVGENIAIEKISAENLQLRDAVKRRTVELEYKNRELEIEAAMEKVRVRSLAMQKPEELAEVAEVLRNEMGALGVEELETSSIYIVDENKGATECWYAIKDIRSKNKKLVTDHMTMDLGETWVGKQMQKFYRSKQTRISILMQGENRKEWINYCAGKSSVLKGYYDGDIPERTYHLLKFSNGFMGAASPGAISIESWDLLQRATSVFSFAYKRFSDLQKAEAQAREAQIEAALERVRTVAMGMTKPEDMLKICRVISEQLQQFGVAHIRNVQTVIINKEKGTYHNYQYFTPYKKEILEVVDYHKNPVALELSNRMIESTDGFFTGTLTGDVFREWRTYRKMEDQLPDPLLDEVDSVDYHFYSIGPGGLGITLYRPLNIEGLEIFKRFHQVFSLAYQRFRDIEQAVSQAREAQIELALERVRARTMAMHNSEELKEVIQEVYNQFVGLNIHVEHAGFILDYKERDDMHIWLTDHQQGVPSEITIPYFDSPHWNSYVEAKAKGENIFSNLLDFEEKNKFYKDLIAQIPQMPAETIQSIFNKPGLAISTVLLDTVGLYIENYSVTPFTAEENATLMRFGKVFQQAYTRFLDLQKAEAQAREAQIEAALERVRSRSLAMHKSEELPEVIQLVFEQLRQLNFNIDSAQFDLNFRENDDLNLWAAVPGQPYPTRLQIPYFNNAVFNSVKHAKEAGLTLAANNFTFEEKNQFFNYFFKYTSIPEERRKFILSLPGFARSVVLLERIALAIQNYSGILYSEAEHAVLLRFAKVFDQTYTRFLDLQKAEAQAREAQIELALERVRARTMAMQHSDELREAVLVIYEQLQQLDFASHACNIIIIDKDTLNMQFWVSGFTNEIYPESYHIPRLHHTYHEVQIAAWQQGVKYQVFEYSGKGKIDFDKMFFTKTDFKNVPEDAKKVMIELKSLKLSTAFFNYGALQVLGAEELSEDKAKTLQRFVKVFDQTYTRFLDLQKAEAQAREAQIEAALERVRSQSMGMQTSKDLSNVTTAMFEQLRMLGGELYATGIVFCDKHEHHVEQWHSVPGAGMLSPFIVPVDLDYIHQYRYDQWKKGVELFSVEIPEDFIAQHFEAIFNLPTAKTVLDDFAAKNIPMPETPSWEIDYGASFKHGYILASALQPFGSATILPRFAKVFEQTYTRFLDLQKAEAQAREAQIETALERVRSRSMAMHLSLEMKDVITVVINQLVRLGFDIDLANFNYLSTPKEWIMWLATPDFTYPELLRLPAIDHPLFNRPIEAAKKGSDFMADTLTQDEFHSVWQHFYATTSMNEYDSDERKEYIAHSTGFARSVVFMKEIVLTISNFKGIPYKEEQNNILKRFAKVFEQSYTRFLDLQKAEAQVREAQIEAALEKVRSRSLAMHKSEELEQVILVVSEQLQQLQFKFSNVSFGFDTEQMGLNFWLASPQLEKPFLIKVPYIDNPAFNRPIQARKNGVDFNADILSPEENRKFLQHMFDFSDLNHIPAESKSFLLGTPGFARSQSLMKNTILTVGNYTPTPYSEEQNAIIKRFGNVFEQAYVRFLDLQKAEAQAREAQIEASLERVRSKTMAMHNSQDVGESVATLFDELVKLGVKTNRCGILIFNNPQFAEVWTAKSNANEKATLVVGKLDMNMHPALVDARASWANKEPFFSYELKGQDMIHYYQSINNSEYYPTQFNLEALPAKEIHSDFHFSDGSLFAFTNEALSTESAAIFKRFTSVFGQTYRRYLDLQKAEASAREAQIEASLERVRSKTMAMHNSQDVGDTVATMFEELERLDVKTNRCGILIYNHATTDTEAWAAKSNPSGKANLIIGHFDASIHPLTIGVREAWKNKQDSYVYELKDDDVLKYYTAISNDTGYPMRFDLNALPSREFQTDFYFPEGAVFAFTPEAVSAEASQIFKRFANVFGQTYRRYLDLQKAEVQAREATIEAALEKVRGKAMAMHTSNDLTTTAGVVFTELKKLGINSFRGGVALIDKESRYGKMYSATSSEEGETLSLSGTILLAGHPVLSEIGDYMIGQLDYFPVLKGELLESYITHVSAAFNSPLIKSNYDEWYGCFLPYSEGAFYVWSDKPYTGDEIKVLKRFNAIVDLTFRRYLDLEKAEAQAREATIEASLERVRGKAMAMQNSNDISATITVVFAELQKLGIKSFRSGIGLITKESRKIKYYSAGNYSPSDENNVQLVLESELDGHEVLSKIYDSWTMQEDYFPVLKGEQFISFYKKLNVNIPDQFIKDANFEAHGYVLQFPEGAFYGWSEKSFTEAEVKILQRFKTIVALTFRRYLELQRAEANALEALRSASLDRVRAEIASMRTKNDLDRITPLIWKELTILGIPFVRCGVFIMDEKEELIHTFLSTPDGKAIAAFHVPYYSTPLAGSIEFWRERKMYHTHWGLTEYAGFADSFIDKNEPGKREQYLSSVPKEGVHLHLLPFLQGMLYVGNTTPLQDDSLSLVQSVADAFSTAYARYEDFNKIESAKAQVEKTLSDLKLTQAQLVQSEKMASLGELTAGIAHEIQNPLNFVNNFSEVSTELIDEMKTELATGNLQLATEISNDLKQNLEKINHHGKRAADIVKGMLQHSRSSSGQKEATDINALADEYLRLAYHGLRAKDKTFNSKFETVFDESIGKVNVIPQDIGRVILNLITNAFYVVNEKSKLQAASFEPLVIVSTKKLGGKIEISVKDNGNGIPQKILDKIFQPFFTTKPTGQGTGLGLSLSYDIVKAHGGELKVETKEGEGSEFIICLPENS
jgi:signal transduction histidine kinase